MAIITENKYLDECTFSSGSIKDEDCADIADWTTDGDTGTGVSSQVFFDNKSCFKMDTVAAGGSNLASRSLDVGSYQTNPNVISIKLYHDTLGTLANVDYFELLAYATSYYLGIRFSSDGLFIYDGAAWNEVGTNLVQTGVWQEWTFSWTMQAAGVVDVYLDGVLQASGVDCSTSTGGTTGTTTFRQYGTTVIGLTYIDWIKMGNGFRYAGETWTIQEGGQLTVRTDTRWNKNSPASYLGSLGGITVTEGKLLFDGRNVRWLAITGGSGDSPIGTTITQGAVSGYYLGFWSSLTAAPTTAIGATGFIKFREVTGGAFSAGALTFGSGTGAATAAGADVTGWIEVVADSASTITVPRLGEHEIRGDWFYLDNTNGSVGQQIQVPTNGGGALTYCPGAWVETAPSAGTYEYWPSAAVAADGWSRANIGGASGETDRRQNFVKDVGGGLIQFGEASDLSATYANVAAQAATYATLAHTCTYTVVSNVCTVYFSTGHLLKTGAQVGVDFTSGGASALDGTFTITVIDAYYYTFALTTADTSGACTVRPGVTISFTAHALGVGDTVYCDATTGTLPDGDYTIYAITSANAYLIAYPHTAALTSGNVSVYSRYVITYTAHGLAIGNRVYLDFTTGSGVDGVYTIVEVPDANTFRIVMNNNASADSGNVTIKQTIGNVPTSGCKVRIPNVFLREAATATRGSNMVNATIASRPEWAVTSAGAIDIEYAYSTWYHNFSQPYSVKHLNVSTYNAIIISECATALDLNNVCNSNSTGSLALAPLTLTSNFAGGTIQNCKFARAGTPASNGHTVAMTYCIGQTFTNVEGIGILFVKSSGYAIGASNCSNLTINSCRDVGLAGIAVLTACNTVTLNDPDHVDRLIGYTNATATSYGVNVGAGSVNIMVDDMTFGYDGALSNVHPFTALFYSANGTNVTFRNMGTFDNPLPCGTWRPNYYALGICFTSGGNNYELRTQRIYTDDNMRTSPFSTVNSDKNITHESVFGGMYTMSGMTPYLLLDAGLNSVMKGCKTGSSSVTGQASVYGTHFFDMFLGSNYGRYVLLCNEPTADTESYFSMISGTRKFNSAGGILMGIVGDQATFEDAYYRKGHTGFAQTEMVMSGGTYSNYTVQYQLNTGSGYGTLKNLSYCRTATAGVNGEYTFTLSDATGVAVDDYIFGTGRVNIGKVTNIEGNVITSNVANSATVSGIIRFNHLPSETITASAGFKLKYQITTILANITAITHIRIETTTTLAAQEDNLYDLDQYTLTLTGLQTGTKVAVVNTGTETLLELLTASAGTVSYTYPSTLVGSGVDLAILAPEFLYQKIVNYVLTNDDASVPVVQNADYGYDDATSATVTFNGTTKRIICDSGTTSISVIGVYTEWVDWALTSNNLRYNAAFSELGGNTIDSGAGTKVPVYGFLVNSWRISPDETDHTLAVTGGIILVDGGGDPFVDTVGDYVVRINYQQPVQAIVVSVSTGSGLSAEQDEQLMKTLTVGKFLGLK